MQAVNTTIINVKFPPPGSYIVAVSGGVDSVTLLHMLATYQMERGWRLRVAHFNHGLRVDSDLDQRLVQEISKIYGLPFHAGSGDLKNSSEDTARKARYSFLHALAGQYGADGIITAHHLGDRRETSLFNAWRGSDRVGLAPMGASNKQLATSNIGFGSQGSDALIIRPVLQVEKSELVNYARLHNLPWREDSSNSNLDYSRNFVRRELLPLAEAEGSEFKGWLDGTISQLGQLNQKIDSRLLQLMRVIVEHDRTEVRVSRVILARLPIATAQHLVAAMVRVVDPGALDAKLVKSLAIVAKAGRSGQRFSVSDKVMALSERHDFIIQRIAGPQEFPFAQELLLSGSVRFGLHQLTIGRHCDGTSHPHIAAANLKVRRVLPGDRIAPTGLNGTKKLQDLFVDAKIDRSKREAWPVVASVSDNRVIWVPQLAISRLHHISASNHDAICLIQKIL